MATASNRDPRHHTQKMQKALETCKLICARTLKKWMNPSEKVDEPQLKAMFETSAEVLSGLCKAFRDSECKNEAAWR